MTINARATSYWIPAVLALHCNETLGNFKKLLKSAISFHHTIYQSITLSISQHLDYPIDTQIKDWIGASLHMVTHSKYNKVTMSRKPMTWAIFKSYWSETLRVSNPAICLTCQPGPPLSACANLTPTLWVSQLVANTVVLSNEVNGNCILCVDRDKLVTILICCEYHAWWPVGSYPSGSSYSLHLAAVIVLSVIAICTCEKPPAWARLVVEWIESDALDLPA